MSSGYETVEYRGWLSAKIPKIPGSPEAAIAIAEASIRTMNKQYKEWIHGVLKILSGHIQQYAKAPSDGTNLDSIRRIAHELRGTTGSFGRMRTSDVSQSLYDQAVRGPSGLGAAKFSAAIKLHHHTLVKLADLDGPDPDPKLDEIVKGLDAIKNIRKS